MNTTSKIEIILNYGLESLSLKLPRSLSFLMEIAKEKYDLTIINRLFYIDVDDQEEVRLTNDTDYLNLIDYVENQNLSKINLILISDESKSRKRNTDNKWLNLKPPVPGDSSFEAFINNANDPEDEVDTRNLKYKMEEGKWSNQSTNQLNLRRVYYIKQKKNMQRAEQMIRDGRLKEIDEGAEQWSADIASAREEINKRVLKNRKNSKIVCNMKKENGFNANGKHNGKKVKK